jgi:hypothetical protein
MCAPTALGERVTGTVRYEAPSEPLVLDAVRGGGMEDWMVGWLDGWKDGRMEGAVPIIHLSNLPHLHPSNIA